jgi:hypothetical protein
VANSSTTIEAGFVAEPAAPPTRQWTTLRAVELFVPPLVFLGIALILFKHMISDPTRVHTGGADNLLSAWYYEWYRYALTHGMNPFISKAVAVPGGMNLMWNNGMFPVAVLCMPFVWAFGAIPTVAYLAMLSPALTATSAYYVLRRLTGRSVGAALGAALFGFGPFTVGHQGHLPLMFLPVVPIIGLVGVRLLVTQDKPVWRTGLLFGVLVALQFLIEEEVLAIVALAIGVAVVVAVIVRPREALPRWRYALTGLAIAGGVVVVLDSIPLYFQFFGDFTPSKTTFGLGTQADLSAFVRPGWYQQYAPFGDRLDPSVLGMNYGENTAFLGWPLLLLATAVCAWMIWRRDRFVWWWLPTWLIIAAFSLGSSITWQGQTKAHGPWEFMTNLPLLGGLLPVRLTVITLLLLAVLIAVVMARLRGAYQSLGTVIVVVALIPAIPVFPYGANAIPPTPKFFTEKQYYDQIPSGADVLVLPIPSNRDVIPMMWQMHTHMRFNIVGGYSLFNRPDQYSGWNYWPQTPAFAQALADTGVTGGGVDPAQLAPAKASIASSHVGYIVVTARQTNAASVVTAARSLTGCTAQVVADVTVCTLPGQ